MNEETLKRMADRLGIPHDEPPAPPPRPTQSDLPTDKYLAEAQFYFTGWADRLRRLDDEIAELKSNIAGEVQNSNRLGQELANRSAAIESARTVIRELETEIAASRDREARALEQVGVMKGMMLSHGSSIAEALGKLGIAAETVEPPQIGAQAAPGGPQ